MIVTTRQPNLYTFIIYFLKVRNVLFTVEIKRFIKYFSRKYFIFEYLPDKASRRGRKASKSLSFYIFTCDSRIYSNNVYN